MTDDAESEDDDHEEKLLVARLRELQLQEAALRKQRRTQQLKDSIAETKQVGSLSTYRASIFADHHVRATAVHGVPSSCQNATG